MNDFQLQQQLQQQQGQQEPLISPDHFRSHKVNNTKSNDILKRLRNASILCIFFLSVEIVGGILSQSLAVLSDAAHLFADLTSFIIAIIAARLSQLPPNAQNTFGYQRAEALAALFSMSSLFVLSLFLGYEAILRGVLFWREYQNAGSGGQEVVGVGVVEDGGSVSGSVSGINVDGRVMTLTALVGVLVNVALAFVLGVENHVHMPGDDHGHDHSHEHGHAHGHGHGHEDHEGAFKSYHDDHHNGHDHGHGHGHDHGHGHGHDVKSNVHEHVQEHNHDHHHDDIDDDKDAHGCVHNHNDHGHGHDHGHVHDDDDDHPHDHDHGDDDDHSHDHDQEQTLLMPTNHGHDHLSHTHDHHETLSCSNDTNHNHKHHTIDDEESQLLLSHSSRDDKKKSSYYGTSATSHAFQKQPLQQQPLQQQKEKLSDGLQDRNLNLHAAYMHVLADLAQSVSVLIAGAAIWYNPDWKLVDPVSTLIFCVLVIRSTIKIILASVSVLMNQVPTEMDWVTVYNRISNVEGVSDVHNLHLWSISHGDRAMSVHARAENIPGGLKAIRQICDELGIQHSTIQLQPVDIDPCVTCGDED